MTNRADRVQRLLADHGRTYCDELSIPIARDTPQPLFRWLTACLLLSARISSTLAVDAARALHAAKIRSARQMCDAGWDRRAQVLHDAGYGRYDESTATYLGDTAALALDRYRGDLRRLREEAGGDRERIVALLQDFKGIGAVGAAIFCREAQGAWDELSPFADERARDAAKSIGLPHSEAGLADLVDAADLPRLLAALTRADIAGELESYG